MSLVPTPDTERGVWEAILDAKAFKDSKECRIVAGVEWIHPAIFQIGKSSMSKLYGSYMALRMAVTAARIPFETVQPVKWQRELGIATRKKTENQSKWKTRLRSKAEQLFPDVPGITLKTCDALLICEYARRTF